MTRRFRTNCLLLSVLLGLAMLAGSPSSGAEPAFKVPRDRDTVFRLEVSTATRHFHFGKDGNYQQVDREHMFTCESDRGKWRQDTGGRIVLESAIRRKQLECGPLRVLVRNVEELEAFGSLEKDIGAFLAADHRDSYPRHDVQRAWKYSYTWSLFESKMTVFPVEVEDRTETITRKQLSQLLEAWKAYLKSDAKNRFKLIPLKYHRFVLLTSEDYPCMANNRTPEEAMKTADMSGGPDNEPAMVYVLIDSEVGLKEMKTKQPFSSFPDMNRVGAETMLRYKYHGPTELDKRRSAGEER
jgi:hypothetical protein